MSNIRPEKADDIDQIRRVIIAAFDQPQEGSLVDRLRQKDNFISELSLVSELENRIIGHILFSPITIRDNDNKFPSLSLAPVSVLPEYQNIGVGTMLVEKGLTTAKDLGYQTVIVLGHPDYYPRFGFEPACRFNIKSPYPVPEEAFMAIGLVNGVLEKIKGVVDYPKEFNDVT